MRYWYFIFENWYLYVFLLAGRKFLLPCFSVNHKLFRTYYYVHHATCFSRINQYISFERLENAGDVIFLQIEAATIDIKVENSVISTFLQLLNILDEEY